jgi:hypothetical protein
VARSALATQHDFGRGQGAFAEEALDLRSYGLCPIPVGGDNDKTPLVKGFTEWKRKPGKKILARWIDQFPNANIAIACGFSDVTIIDIDDPKLVDYMIKRCGETPLITRTPSGGVHLWYRSSGERNANLRSHGPDVDVRGVGGIAVVPPSVRKSGDHAGQYYEFISGSWSDLPRLPYLRDGSLSFDIDEQPQESTKSNRRVVEGIRNDTLFRFLKDQARNYDTPEDLLGVAYTRNMEFERPLSDPEVVKVVGSVWSYRERGELWTKGDAPRVVLSGGEDGVLAALYENPDALALYCKLKESHGAGRKRFAIAPKAMVRDKVLPSFKSHNRYLNARRFLLKKGLLTQVHQGGKGTGDPSMFTFPSKKGVNSTPNVTKTPSPSASPPPWGWEEEKE